MSSGITYHICAVDGGGTGCRVAIARADGSVLARASGGPANYTTNPAQSAQNILAAVQEAALQLGPDAPAIRTLVAHVGLAGIMNDRDSADMASRLPFDICTVTEDSVTSAIGALGGRDGVLLAIGTGSLAAARKGGDLRFFGGWGFQVGDQASGAWLGRALLEHSLLAHDGLEPETDLTRQVLARFDGGPAGIAGFASRAVTAEYAALAPLVTAAAGAGDAAGLALMARGAAYLNAVLTAADPGADTPICLIGGVGPHYAGLLAPQYRARLSAPEGTALDGALRLARQQLRQRLEDGGSPP